MNKIAFALTGARAPMARILLFAFCVIALAAILISASGCSDDDGGDVTFPTPPAEEFRNWVFDIYGTDAGDIYACGNRGAMFHYDGTSWTHMDMGTGDPIVRLWHNDGTYYAVGHGGRVWQNTSGTWNSMDSGTSQNLYGIGIFDEEVYICGGEGTLRRLNGGSWSSVPTEIVLRDPATGATTDTLSREMDLSSLLTVNHYFIGGAYKLPDFEGEEVGMLGTDGMVLASDPEYDWLLRPLRGDELADSEWVLSTTSNALVLQDNYLGTSEGWLFQLSEDDEGNLVWVKSYPRMTDDPGSGIRDLWLDENSYVFAVTDDGQLWVQSPNYSFTEGTGFRKLLYDQISELTGIWGSASDNIYMAGLVENKIFQVAVDYSDTTLSSVVEIPLDFPAAKSMGLDPFEDELGRPRF